ncbi:glycine zipper 2TM domain-containing protein [Dyella tabacisoli]|uniref:Glycine zipper 2TM domain-containing protein n=1 Tax=Dyella tabacisoli TaxID=2282381 RepID=A0A369UKT5_9GAMM|nr:glycine zipper 2TM domain-containing protein [Dyella tabacisoli]RDD81117.1 glycine zipper 2TM domain-containing protein [Dyella tabacisoli]
MNKLSNKLALAALVAGSMSLVGCATPYERGRDYGNQGRYQNSSQGGYGQGGYGDRYRCQSCGVVQDVQQVETQGGNDGTLGTVIGAVAGGLLGNQVGRGNGRKAATVAGAVVGGVVGNQVGKGGGGVAYRVSVRLDNGQYVNVTQRDDPRVRQGDYVEVSGDQVILR